jgi:hypothetical protein
VSEIVACPSCGETYVSTTDVCADCGLPLVEPGSVPPAPYLDPTHDEVGYDLADWDAERRGELVTQLTTHSIPHRWEEGELVVRERDADTVEPLIDDIDHPDALEPEDDDDDAAAELLSSLYVASDVLAGDHANPGAVLDLCEAEREAQDMDTPYGVAPSAWEAIRERASALAALLDVGEESDIRHAARDLRDLLRPLV